MLGSFEDGPNQCPIFHRLISPFKAGAQICSHLNRGGCEGHLPFTHALFTNFSLCVESKINIKIHVFKTVSKIVLSLYIPLV